MILWYTYYFLQLYEFFYTFILPNFPLTSLRSISYETVLSVARIDKLSGRSWFIVYRRWFFMNLWIDQEILDFKLYRCNESLNSHFTINGRITWADHLKIKSNLVSVARRCLQFPTLYFLQQLLLFKLIVNLYLPEFPLLLPERHQKLQACFWKIVLISLKVLHRLDNSCRKRSMYSNIDRQLLLGTIMQNHVLVHSILFSLPFFFLIGQYSIATNRSRFRH